MSINFRSPNQIDDQIEEKIEESPSPNDAGMIADGPEHRSTAVDTASHLDSRIEEIQSSVLAERVVISELHEQISDSELRHDLRRAMYCLENIEDVFLSSAMRDKRTPGALARWLSYAEFQLKMSAGRRAEVQGIVARGA
jgi:hypothetical protein